ncbi:GPCR fungal pheromone mating factor, partial [Mrakia frigida]|uniref:pheromone receptor n=1 Tax=Mrakia frigida TaxID=29902 RepID=UPI003FCBFD79
DLLFIIYAAVAMVLLLLASPPHFRSANVGAICLVAWCFVGAFGFFVNAIVWWDNVEDHAPVWCDIWTRIHVGLATGIASGCLCINRRLYIISSARRTSVSSKDRRKGLILDLAIGLVPPFFVMAIYYTVQGNRYNLAEGFGCLPAPYINWHAILACYVPALTVGAASFCYGGLSIWNFTSRRLQFQSVLQTSGGGLNTSRFIRLVSLSTVEMLVSVPLGSWVISYIVDTSFMPVLSWNDTHADFSMVYIFNADSMLANPTSARGNSVQRWIPVFATFLYFSFFGVQEEALVSYWSAL